jgi:hypothetical protein
VCGTQFLDGVLKRLQSVELFLDRSLADRSQRICKGKSVFEYSFSISNRYFKFHRMKKTNILNSMFSRSEFCWQLSFKWSMLEHFTDPYKNIIATPHK